MSIATIWPCRPVVTRLCLVAFLSLAGLWVFPSSAQAAASCSASSMSQFMPYGGTPSWADFSSYAGCSDPSAVGTYAICTANGQQPGTGGTSLSPYRQLAGSGASLSWQLYDAARTSPLTGPGVQLGTITFANPYFGSTQIAYSAHIPLNSTLVNGSYSATVVMPLELRQGSCSGALESNFTFTFTLDVTVSTYCQILGTQPLSFGLARATTALTVDATGAITVECYYGGFTIALGDGLHASAGQRRVSNGSDTLDYNIYTGPDRTIPWQGSTTVAGTSNGAPVTLMLYGRMPGQPTPSPGLYTDVIVATVTF